METLFIFLGFVSLACCYHRLHLLDDAWRAPPHSGNLLRLYSDESDYYAKLRVGDQDNMKIFFDSSFNKLAVLSSKCTTPSCYWRRHRYNGKPVEKKTSRFQVLGNWVGALKSKDNIVFGDQDADNVIFYQVVNETNRAISKHYDGVFGLSGVNNSFVHEILSVLTQPFITLSLNRDGGYIIFSGTLKDVDLKFIPAIKTSNPAEDWTVPVTFIESKTKGFKHWCSSGCIAQLQTTEEAIVGPREDIKSIHRYIGAKKVGNDFIVDCEKIENLPTLKFHIYGEMYSLEAKYYIKKVSSIYGQRSCVTVFKESKTAFDHWILGQPFFHKYVVVFSYENDEDVVNEFVAFTEYKSFNMFENLKINHD